MINSSDLVIHMESVCLGGGGGAERGLGKLNIDYYLRVGSIFFFLR